MNEPNTEAVSLLQEDRSYLLEIILPGIAHEINNNNQTILLSGQVLLEVWESLKPVADRYLNEHGDYSVGGLDYSAVGDELAGYYANLLHGAEEIEKMVTALRDFLHYDPSTKDAPVDLNRLIDRALILLANSIRKATDNLRFDPAPGIPVFRGCPRNIAQVLLHLIRNACLSLTSQKQAIEISTRYDRAEGTARCAIRNEGGGLAPELLARIRSFLAGGGPLPPESYPGLAALRRIMANHDGEADFQSGVGGGTTVTLSFPVRRRGEQHGQTQTS